MLQISKDAQEIRSYENDLREARIDAISSIYQIQLDAQREQAVNPRFAESPISKFYGPDMLNIFRVTGQMPETMQMAINFANDPAIRNGDPRSRLTRIQDRIKVVYETRNAMGKPIEEKPEKLREMTSFLSDFYLAVKAMDTNDADMRHAYSVQGLIESFGSKENANIFAPEKLEARALASAGFTNPYEAWMHHQIGKINMGAGYDIRSKQGKPAAPSAAMLEYGLGLLNSIRSKQVEPAAPVQGTPKNVNESTKKPVVPAVPPPQSVTINMIKNESHVHNVEIKDSVINNSKIDSEGNLALSDVAMNRSSIESAGNVEIKDSVVSRRKMTKKDGA